MESKAFHLIRAPPLTSCLLPLSMLPLSQSSIAIFMLTALLNLLTACFPSSHSLAILNFLHKLTPICRNPLCNSESVPHFFHPFHWGKLWNSLPASVLPVAYDLNALKRRVSRHLCNLNGFLLFDSHFKKQRVAGFFFYLLFLPMSCILKKRKEPYAHFCQQIFFLLLLLHFSIYLGALLKVIVMAHVPQVTSRHV